MSTTLPYSLIKDLIAATFVLLFVYTGISKLEELSAFQLVLQQSPLLSGIATPLSIVMPIIELGIAGLLIVPVTRSAGLKASVILMTIFTGYIGYMLKFSRNLPCSCGGALRSLTWTQHLLFNLMLIILGSFALWIDQHQHLYCNKQEKPKTCIKQ